MQRFIKTCRSTTQVFDHFATLTGHLMAWLTLLMVITTTGIVIFRHVFEAGSIGAQESVTYMHAFVLMLASAYTLREQGHVRVDIFYRRFTPLQRAWVDVFGSLLCLLPLAIASVALSWDFVAVSWANKEASADAGGIPAIFVLKSLLLANGVLLGMQAIAEICRNLVTISVKETA